MTNRLANPNIVGLNHQYPPVPQYSVSESAAALLTLARPNITNMMLGKQHIEAITVDVEISLMRELGLPSFSSM
jgi:hypothetical protein